MMRRADKREPHFKGSKKGTEITTKFAENELRFINSTDPAAFKSTDSRKAVRSYAALVAHRNVRREQELKYGPADRNGDSRMRKSQTGQAQVERQQLAAPSSSSEHEIPTTEAAHSGAAYVHSPLDIIATKRRDIFQTSVIHLTSFEEYLVDHFVKHVIPGTAVYYPRSKSEPSYQESMNLYWMPFALANPGALNGLLSAACRSLALLYNADEYLTTAFLYNGKCIRYISEATSMQGKIVDSDSILGIVLLLASTDFHIGNLANTRKHIIAATELVKLKGGLQNLGLCGFLQQLVLWLDRTVTFFTGVPPSFNHIATSEESIHTDSIMPGFQNMSVLSQLGPVLTKILNDACVYTSHIIHLSVPWDEHEHDFLISTADELEARLLVLASDHQNQFGTHTYTPIEECLCLSLKVFVTLMPHKNSFPPTGCKHLSSRIGKVISEIMSVSSWYQHADLCLWLAFMGGIVARAGELKEQDLAEYFARLRKQTDLQGQFEYGFSNDSNFWIFLLLEIGSVLGATTKDDFKTQLRRFLWVDTLCDPYSVDIWNTIEQVQLGLGKSQSDPAFPVP